MESAYDLRWVSAYHPTPGRVAARPYVHRSGAEEMRKLQQIHQRFLIRFPETYYVEASRHGQEPGADYEPFNWPHQYFQQKVVLTNSPLLRLIRAGVWPQAHKPYAISRMTTPPSWYNTPADIENVMRAAGRPVHFMYDGWQVAEVQRGVYIRAGGPHWGRIRVKNLVGRPLRGRFVMQAGLAAPEQAYDVQIFWQGRQVASDSRWGRIFWSVETPTVEVPPGEHELAWGVRSGGPEIQALMLADLQFQAAGAEDAASAAPAPDPAAPAAPAPPTPAPTPAPREDASGPIIWTPPE
jgi:hypothetical protein